MVSLAEVNGYFQNIPEQYLFELKYTDEELQRIDEKKARRHRQTKPARAEAKQPRVERNWWSAANVIQGQIKFNVCVAMTGNSQYDLSQDSVCLEIRHSGSHQGSCDGG